MLLRLVRSEGRGGRVFPLHQWLGRRRLGSGDGFVPGAGVGSDGGEGPGLEGCAAGGEGDLAAVGAELVAADAVEFSYGLGRLSPRSAPRMSASPRARLMRVSLTAA